MPKGMGYQNRGLGNEGGGPQREASLGQVRDGTSGGSNTPGTINAGNSGGGDGMSNAKKQERPPNQGLGN